MEDSERNMAEHSVRVKIKGPLNILRCGDIIKKLYSNATLC